MKKVVFASVFILLLAIIPSLQIKALLMDFGRGG